MVLRRTDVDDIPLTQLSLVWNSVTDDFVDRPGLNLRQTGNLADTRGTHVQTDFGKLR